MEINLQVNETKEFLRTTKKIKDHFLTAKLEETIQLLKVDHQHISLQFKKIICKKDKYRHSVRVPGTDYRILMSAYEHALELICICDHDKYNRLNKDC